VGAIQNPHCSGFAHHADVNITGISPTSGEIFFLGKNLQIARKQSLHGLKDFLFK
jgi:hypothetical protein